MRSMPLIDMRQTQGGLSCPPSKPHGELPSDAEEGDTEEVTVTNDTVEWLHKPDCKPEQIIRFSSFDDVEDDDEIDFEAKDVSQLIVAELLQQVDTYSSMPHHTIVPRYSRDSPYCNPFTTLNSPCASHLIRLKTRSRNIERPRENEPVLIVDGAADVGLLGKG